LLASAQGLEDVEPLFQGWSRVRPALGFGHRSHFIRIVFHLVPPSVAKGNIGMIRLGFISLLCVSVQEGRHGMLRSFLPGSLVQSSKHVGVKTSIASGFTRPSPRIA
jgi:hypothetical protein